MLALLLATGVLAYRTFEVIRLYSVNILFFDQWDFLGPLFSGETSLASLFLYQHGPHREGLGLVADRAIYPLTRWNARAESFLIGACVFAAMALALLLKRKLFGRFSFGDVAIPMMFLTLTQYETFIGTPNAAYSGLPLLLIMLYCLALLHPNYRFRYALCLVLNFLLIYTGFGLFMGLITSAVFALECYWWLRSDSVVPFGASFAALGVAVLSFASFFAHYTFTTATGCFDLPWNNWLEYPWFMALMIGRFFDFVIPGALSTPTAVLGILCAGMGASWLAFRLVRGKRFRAPELIAGILVAFSTVFAINTAIGRACLDLPQAAWASRYVTLLIPGVLGVYFYLQSLPWPDVRRILVGALTLLLVPGCLFLYAEAGWFAAGKRAWMVCYLRSENIAACDRSTRFPVHPHPEETGLKEKLDYLKKRRLSFFAGTR